MNRLNNGHKCTTTILDRLLRSIFVISFALALSLGYSGTLMAQQLTTGALISGVPVGCHVSGTSAVRGTAFKEVIREEAHVSPDGLAVNCGKGEVRRERVGRCCS